MSFIKEFHAGKLKVRVYETREIMGKEAAREAAARIREILNAREEANIIFAAAPSQNEFLAWLIREAGIRWDRINAFHMDEYIGLNPGAPQGFGNFLRKRIFDKVGFKSVNFINGNARDINGECRRYAELLKQYPADVICMGIGENGHIAFNDPHVARFNDSSLVKIVELDERCRRQQVNDGCFASIGEVPTHAITLTIPALVSASHIFCMVPGKTKAEAVFNTVYGEVSETCPASILKTLENAILYTDQDSASLLK